MRNKNLIILQARTSSKRLKNKILLPIKNKPLFVYCYDRLKKSNIKIVCATSVHKSDNIIENICKKNKINFFRGSLKNVLKRFLDYTSKLDDNVNIIRATADNPLPDSFFINKSLEFYNKYKLDFFFTDHNFYGLPYGLNIEIIKLSLLRKQKSTKLNKEHVTWDLRKNYNLKKEKKFFLKKRLDHLNFSIDTIDDYLLIKRKLEKFKSLSSHMEIIKNEIK